MSLKQEINGNYFFYDDFFRKKTGRAIDDLEMSEIRDYFIKILDSNESHFGNTTQAEEAFLYLYHYRELQEIKRIAVRLREMKDPGLYERFIMEFFDDNSPSGLQDLKVHLINNESDKIWFSKKESSDIKIEKWRKERFSKYL